tara:strand:+ start:262 stop:444 length:183 start_codon:yes stop_codon:yes gene_type:complete
MFKNKNIEFWFWCILAGINVFVIMIAQNNEDDFTFALGFCVLFLCLAKGLICAIEIDRDK